MNIQSIVDTLRGTIVEHPYYELAYQRLYNLSAVAQPGSVITVVGPTRVGKTYLSRRLEQTLVSPIISEGSQAIPIVRIEAAATDKGFISTRYLMLQLLLALEHPFYVDEGYKARFRDTEATLRKHVVASLIARQTRYIIIDEAHHLLRTQSNRLAESVLDSIKCLGNETGSVVIFIGGYDLLAHQYLSAHLNGRMTVIDFPNYGTDHVGIQGFDRLLITVDEWLPWRRGGSLYHFRDRIYQGTLGCYGQLIHWSISALAEMKAVGDSALKLAHFASTRRLGQVRVIEADLVRGRKMSADLSDKPRVDNEEEVPKQAKKHRARPFKRNPVRDRVGHR